jgi:hypothetical protein
MEIVSPDALDVVSRRAYTAFRRIGKVLEYNPTEFVEGRIYVNGWPALVTVEWRPHRDGERVCVDIAASSNDELNRAADEAMYRFASEFKSTRDGNIDLPNARPGLPSGKAVGWALLALLLTAALAAFLLGLPPFAS